MAEEPTNAELAWRLERITEMLAPLVGRPEYEADKRGLDRQFAELQRDLDEERRDRSEAIRALSKRLDDQAAAAGESRMHWRTLLWTGVLPAVVALLGVVVTLWISHHGGHG